jgi:phage I-like protein
MTVLRGAVAPLRAAAVESKAWNLIFPRGEWHGPNLAPLGGSITIDDGMLSELVANWEAAGRPPLPVRVTHAHLEEADPVKRLELERAVGLLSDMRVTADGLEVLTEWTPAGVEAVRGGAWNFWSPEWLPEHTDRRTGEKRGWWLSGVALTNDPFFNSMPAVAASTALPPGSPTGTPNKEQHMSYAKIAAALGMPEDSTEEAIVAECMKMKGGMAPPPPLMQASVKAEVSKAVEPLQASLKAANEKVAALEAEAQKAKDALFARDVDAVIEDAKREGFTCEPMRKAVQLVASHDGLEAAKSLARTAPKVAMSAAGVGGEKPTTVTASAQEYGAALAAFEKESGLSGMSAVRAFHTRNPAMAKAVANAKLA